MSLELTKSIMNSFWLKFLATLYYFILILNLVYTAQTEEKRMLNLARKNILKREKEYLKKRPMSAQLSSFISRYKKSVVTDRNKRDGDGEDYTKKKGMYVVKNGEVVPVEEGSNGDLDSTKQGNFTIVPLVIPIILEQNVTDIPDRLTPYNSWDHTEEKSVFKDEPIEKCGECSTEEESRREYQPEAPERNAKESAPLHDYAPPDRDGKMEDLKHNLDNYQKAPNKAKKSRLLDKILKDVEELAEEQDLRKLERSEGALCKVHGDWDSESGGMRISVSQEQSHGDGPAVTIAPKEPPADEGFLRTGTWTFYARVPFNHSSIITLTAINNDDKKIATFIGECRTCQESESIQGAWLIGRLSKDCQDLKASYQYIDDVFRKDNIRKLQEEHLFQMTSTSDTNTCSTP